MMSQINMFPSDGMDWLGKQTRSETTGLSYAAKDGHTEQHCD